MCLCLCVLLKDLKTPQRSLYFRCSWGYRQCESTSYVFVCLWNLECTISLFVSCASICFLFVWRHDGCINIGFCFCTCKKPCLLLSPQLGWTASCNFWAERKSHSRPVEQWQISPYFIVTLNLGFKKQPSSHIQPHNKH